MAELNIGYEALVSCHEKLVFEIAHNLYSILAKSVYRETQCVHDNTLQLVQAITLHKEMLQHKHL